MFLVTNWFFKKEWMTILLRLIPEILVMRVISKTIILILAIIVLCLSTIIELNQKSQFLFGMLFMFLVDAILNSNFFTKDIRNHVATFIKKKFMKVQYLLIMIISVIFVFVLK